MRILIAITILMMAGTALADSTPPPPPASMNEVVTAPRSANNHVMMFYPPEARAKHQQGTVRLKFTVDVDGIPRDITVTESSGFPLLDEETVKEVGENWRYVPAIKDGKPIAGRLETTVRWTLGQDERNPVPSMEKRDPVQNIEMTQADFPPGAFDKGETGTTYLSVVFDSHGAIIKFGTTTSSGYPDLDWAAMNIVRLWKATPPILNGQAITFVVPVAMHWPAKQ